jgi:hypothetical protein
MLLLARIVRLVTMVVAGVIVVGILLHVLGANGSNAVVQLVYDIDRPLVAPFKNLFDLKDAKAQIALNWGIGAAVYALAGMLVARLLAGVGFAASRGRRRRPGVV